MDETFTTKEVAEIFNVNDSTIKRWADNGTMNCIKTPGGHRKFKLQHIKEFSEKYSYDSAISIKITRASERLKQQIAFFTHSKNFDKLCEYFESLLLKGRERDASELLLNLYTNKITLQEIFDNIIQPALEDIGIKWEKKKIGIELEHLSTGIAMRSLFNLQSHIYKKDPSNVKILCGCLEGELHELGIMCVRNQLESMGYNVIYLGANTPLNSFINAINNFKPDFICLSISTPGDVSELNNRCKNIYKAAKKLGSKLIIGGNFVKINKEPCPQCDKICHNIKELLNILKK